MLQTTEERAGAIGREVGTRIGKQIAAQLGKRLRAKRKPSAFNANNRSVYSAMASGDRLVDMPAEQTAAFNDPAVLGYRNEYFALLRSHRESDISLERFVMGRIYDSEGQSYSGDSADRAALRAGLKSQDAVLNQKYGVVGAKRMTVDSAEHREAREAAPGPAMGRQLGAAVFSSRYDSFDDAKPVTIA